jgi:medium-chain acyl-[acyl-carrier-protein] hydrolase
MTAKHPMLKLLRAVPGARARLICIPYAGGGAWSYRAWAPQLPDGVELLSVQLPGREDRLMEPPYNDVHTLVAELAGALEPELALPYALFGHSMGALIAFELVRELRRRGAPPASQLLASGYRAPQVPCRMPPIHELDDDAFVDEVVRRYDAVPPAARESKELMELVLPGLRGDISVCDTYVYSEDEPLPCSITAIGGTEDDNVSRQDLEAWARQTSASFACHMLPGGHFFLQTAQEQVLELVAGRLGEV